jgi:D-glycero-alpha-D-manno-heptose-7-phosphate kinase
MINKVSARYSISETVNHPRELQHTRIRAALLDLGIETGIEIGSYASLPAKTGLGSSSSFSVALVKALHAFLGKTINKQEAAEYASRLEIELVGEPIGKQDQYAAAFGGFNIFQFNPDHSVTVEPVLIDYKKQIDLENHTLLFFTGITRDASSVLSEQKSNIDKKMESLKQMADSVFQFHDLLMNGDIRGMAEMLHEGWLRKKSLAQNVSNSFIDELYQSALHAGAWGGKIVGAGGGGCLFLLVSPDKRERVLGALQELTRKANLVDAREIPIRFTKSGADLLFHTDHNC